MQSVQNPSHTVKQGPFAGLIVVSFFLRQGKVQRMLLRLMQRLSRQSLQPEVCISRDMAERESEEQSLLDSVSSTHWIQHNVHNFKEFAANVLKVHKSQRGVCPICPICLDPLEVKDKKCVVLFKCNHLIHKGCAKELLKHNVSKLTCPLCRAKKRYTWQ